MFCVKYYLESYSLCFLLYFLFYIVFLKKYQIEYQWKIILILLSKHLIFSQE